MQERDCCAKHTLTMHISQLNPITLFRGVYFRERQPEALARNSMAGTIVSAMNSFAHAKITAAFLYIFIWLVHFFSLGANKNRIYFLYNLCFAIAMSLSSFFFFVCVLSVCVIVHLFQ